MTRKEGELKSMISTSVRYLFLRRQKTLDFKAILKLKKYIKSNQIQVVHAHSTSYFIASCIKLLSPSIKLIWHDHYGNSEFLDSRKNFILKALSYLFKHVIVVNQKLLIWNQKYLFAKNYVMLNNFPNFMYLGKDTVLKGADGKRIVHVAGFTEQKDHMNLLRAFHQLLEEETSWSLHLIGKQYEGHYLDTILEYIAKHQLSDSVFLYGVRTDIKNVLSQATIGVLSSKSEGLPVALLEYGLAKLPVVVTDVGECSTLIKNKKVVVSPENSIELSKALLYLIRNQEQRQLISEELFHLVTTEYSIDSFTKRLEDIYNN